MVKNIGGFFEEETIGRYSGLFHSPGAIKLVNGRSALLFLLAAINPKKIKLPFYSCDSLLQPIKQLKIPYEYYAIDENFLPQKNNIEKDDFIIFINFFGIQEKILLGWAQEFGVANFVMDNTQSFFSKSDNYFAFNSARKFFGLTDGAYLFAKDINSCAVLADIEFNNDFLNLRKNGDLARGYEFYKKNEIGQPCGFYKMSIASENILNGINYHYVMQKRSMNYDMLSSKLSSFNRLNYLSRIDNIPFAYPFHPIKSIDKTLLYNAGIFPPTLWQEVLERPGQKFEWERKLAAELIPLPIDHRYDAEDMEYIISNILTLLK